MTLALVEVIDRDGRVRRAQPVAAWPVRIGRAIDNDVVLDDPHVAPYHARIDGGDGGNDGGNDGGAPQLTALASVNGIRVGRRLLRDGDRVPLPTGHAGDAGWTIGTIRLRVRLAGEPLAPERALVDEPNHVGTVLLALLLWAWMLAEHWVRIDPGSRPSDWLQPLLVQPAALAAWCASWALASKLFQQRFEFWPHLAIAVRYALAGQVVGFALDWFGAATGWELPSRLDSAAVAAVALALVVAHARLVLPERRRILLYVAAGFYIAGTALVVALNMQRGDRWFDELYMTQLPPPALRLSSGVAPQQFLRETEALKPGLDTSARRADPGERDDADEGDAE